MVLSPEADLFVEQACLAVSLPAANSLYHKRNELPQRSWSAPMLSCCQVCCIPGREGTGYLLCTTLLGPRFNADLHSYILYPFCQASSLIEIKTDLDSMRTCKAMSG